MKTFKIYVYTHERPHLADVLLIDATDREAAIREGERRINRRTHYLHTIHEVEREPEPTLDEHDVVARAATLVSYVKPEVLAKKTPAKSVYVPRWAVQALVEALEAHRPGMIAQIREAGREAAAAVSTGAERTCPRHGGPWGSDETCPRCTNADGTPRVFAGQGA